MRYDNVLFLYNIQKINFGFLSWAVFFLIMSLCNCLNKQGNKIILLYVTLRVIFSLKQ